MSAEWILIIVVTIFIGKCDIMNCSCCRVVTLFEYGIKVGGKVLENRFDKIVT